VPARRATGLSRRRKPPDPGREGTQSRRDGRTRKGRAPGFPALPPRAGLGLGCASIRRLTPTAKSCRPIGAGPAGILWLSSVAEAHSPATPWCRSPKPLATRPLGADPTRGSRWIPSTTRRDLRWLMYCAQTDWRGTSCKKSPSRPPFKNSQYLSSQHGDGVDVEGDLDRVFAGGVGTQGARSRMDDAALGRLDEQLPPTLALEHG